MGLDMYLSARRFVSGYGFSEDRAQYEEVGAMAASLDMPAPSQNTPHGMIQINVGYWRKANQIHQWFVDNVQEGTDDCGEYWVGRETLRELHDLCVRLLASRDTNEAKEHLPTASGFFFGDTAYETWYWEQLEDTVEILKPLIDKEYSGDFYYHSSW
jgi:hypothetical protein